MCDEQAESRPSSNLTVDPPILAPHFAGMQIEAYFDKLAELLDRRFSWQDEQLERVMQELCSCRDGFAVQVRSSSRKLSPVKSASVPATEDEVFDGVSVVPHSVIPVAALKQEESADLCKLTTASSMAAECSETAGLETSESDAAGPTKVKSRTTMISRFSSFLPSTRSKAPSSRVSADTEEKIQEELDQYMARRCPGGKGAKPRGRSVDMIQRTSTCHEVWVDGEAQFNRFWRRYVAFVQSIRFDYGMGVFIFLNTIFLGAQVDRKVRRLALGADQDADMSLSIIESCFAAIFLIELLMRLSAWRLRFCCSMWNIFDTVVVLCGTLEECLKYGLGGDRILGKLRILRMMRVFKLMRTLRIIRVLRVFRELRIVMMSIISCLRSLVWTLLLLFMTIYIIAILILVELTNANTAFDDSESGKLQSKYFCHLFRSLMTLFQTITGGVMWEEASSALHEAIPWLEILWVFYIGFCAFAIANTVTGIFVDQAMKSAQDDVRNVMQEEQEKRSAAIAELRNMFYHADSEGLGKLTRECMARSCKTRKVMEILKEFDIEASDVMALFELVANVDLTIPLENIDSFTRSLFRLKGVAKNIDVVALTMRQKVLQREIKDRVMRDS